ncbi:TAXI family TRAP transporter solute-binding subunit [Microbacterium sp. 2FI]|uniref:TAXI family TRAP transporter solute-binding subunit n=1 Tax=Microbacterium sp. 2FI TaxID=2502193 RepID=UPI0010F9818B|nr:TAXI family TRAP transporter solute-binding subunit [Microbacterium sp. 2FI]
MGIESREPLKFRADWGGANLLRASGWLSQWVWDHTADHRLSEIHTGRGMGDNLSALGAGQVDVAFATPAAFARLARDGRGPFEGRAIENLVAVGALPHRDAMLPVARADSGLRTLADVAAHPGPLRVSVGVNDPDGFMGFGGDLVLDAGGVDLDEIVRRGGTVTRHEQPFDVIDDLREGRADLMVSEAIMTPDWQALAREQDVRFISLTPDEARRIEDRWGLGVIEIPPGYFPSQDYPVVGLDYSDWICATTADLDDETAALLADAFIHGGEALARGYRHLPVDYSPLRYPIDYRVAGMTSIPLHPAVERAYESASTHAEVS